MKKILALIMLILFAMSILTSAFNIPQIRAEGTIYIRADGSIDPPDAPILNVGNVYYTFTADIYDSIVVERSNIIIDGNRRTLQGSESGTGISLSGRENVTIKNTNIKNNGYGIYLSSSSNYNSISGNNITANNAYGIRFDSSSDNTIFHNNFINNTNQVYSSDSVNTWDDGYPSGGNYWSDYEERYPNATEINDSGIWNTSYVIDENNQDNYPKIIPEFPSGVILPLFMMVTLIAVLLLRRKRRILCSRPKEVYLNLKQHTTYAD